MEPTAFNSSRKAAKTTGVPYGALRHVKGKERYFVKKDEKIYKIKSC